MTEIQFKCAFASSSVDQIAATFDDTQKPHASPSITEWNLLLALIICILRPVHMFLLELEANYIIMSLSSVIDWKAEQICF